MQKKGYHNVILLVTAITAASYSLRAQTIVASQSGTSTYLLGNASICVDLEDHASVQLAAGFLQQDMEAVTGKRPELRNSNKTATSTSPMG